MRESLISKDKSVLFSETFNSFADIAKNWWTVNWNPTITNWVMDFDWTWDFIDWYPIRRWVKSIEMVITMDTTTEDIIDFDGGTHSIEVSWWTITATWFSSPTFYVDWVATATITTNRAHVVVTTATAFDATALKIWQETDTYAGTIDFVNVYDRVLTAAEVSALSTNSLYIYPSKSTVISIDHRQWTSMDTDWWTVTNNNVWIVSEWGIMVADFIYSSSSYISLADKSDYSFGNWSADSPFSIETWCRPTDIASSKFLPIMAKSDWGANQEYQFFMGSNGYPAFYLFDSGWNRLGRRYTTDVLAAELGSWIHLVATYDGSSTNNWQKIYLNGVQVENNVINSWTYGAMSDTSQPVEIQKDGSNYSWARRGLTKLYNVELTAADVARAYNSNKNYFNK